MVLMDAQDEPPIINRNFSAKVSNKVSITMKTTENGIVIKEIKAIYGSNIN